MRQTENYGNALIRNAIAAYRTLENPIMTEDQFVSCYMPRFGCDMPAEMPEKLKKTPMQLEEAVRILDDNAFRNDLEDALYFPDVVQPVLDALAVVLALAKERLQEKAKMEADP